MPNILWFQLLKSEDLLFFTIYFYFFKQNIFGFWAVGQDFAFWEILMCVFFNFQAFWRRKNDLRSLESASHWLIDWACRLFLLHCQFKIFKYSPQGHGGDPGLAGHRPVPRPPGSAGRPAQPLRPGEQLPAAAQHPQDQEEPAGQTSERPHKILFSLVMSKIQKRVSSTGSVPGGSGPHGHDHLQEPEGGAEDPGECEERRGKSCSSATNRTSGYMTDVEITRKKSPVFFIRE